MAVSHFNDDESPVAPPTALIRLHLTTADFAVRLRDYTLPSISPTCAWIKMNRDELYLEKDSLLEWRRNMFISFRFYLCNRFKKV